MRSDILSPGLVLLAPGGVLDIVRFARDAEPAPGGSGVVPGSAAPRSLHAPMLARGRVRCATAVRQSRPVCHSGASEMLPVFLQQPHHLGATLDAVRGIVGQAPYRHLIEQRWHCVFRHL